MYAFKQIGISTNLSLFNNQIIAFRFILIGIGTNLSLFYAIIARRLYLAWIGTSDWQKKTNWSTISLLRVSSLYHANSSEIPKLSAEKHLQNIPTSILAPCILMCSWMSKYLQRNGKIGNMQKCYIHCRILHWEPYWWFLKMGATSNLVPRKKRIQCQPLSVCSQWRCVSTFHAVAK